MKVIFNLCPLSMLVSFEAIHRARNMTLLEDFMMEYDLITSLAGKQNENF
jgi:hypothetical protein